MFLFISTVIKVVSNSNSGVRLFIPLLKQNDSIKSADYKYFMYISFVSIYVMIVSLRGKTFKLLILVKHVSMEFYIHTKLTVLLNT